MRFFQPQTIQIIGLSLSHILHIIRHDAILQDLRESSGLNHVSFNTHMLKHESRAPQNGNLFNDSL